MHKRPPILLLLVVSCHLLFAITAQGSLETSTAPPPPGAVGGCVDSDKKCSEWAASGECQSNAVWMMSNCRLSCNACQGGDRAWKLRSHIAANYDLVAQQNQSHRVRLDSVRVTRVEVDERNEAVKLSGRMVFSWNDSSVAWNRREWGVSWLNFYWVQIWSPIIVQTNGVNGVGGSAVGKVLAANHTGQVYLWTDFTFTAPAAFRYAKFPNDEQRACVEMDDKRWQAVELTVAEAVRNGQHDWMDDTRLSGWRLLAVEVDQERGEVEWADGRGNAPNRVHADPLDLRPVLRAVRMCVRVQRHAVYYVSQLLTPALTTALFTVSALFVGHLRTVQPVLLAFSVLCQLVALQLASLRLPVFSAGQPSILKFLSFNLTVTSLSFVASLLLRRLFLCDSSVPPPHSVSLAVSNARRLLRMPEPEKDDQQQPGGYYAEIAHTLNTLLFMIVVVLYAFAVICTFVI